MKLYILRDTLAFAYANIIYAENDNSAVYQAQDFLAQRKVINPTLNPKDFKLFYVCTFNSSSEDIPAVTDNKTRAVDLDYDAIEGFYNAWLDKEQKIFERNMSSLSNSKETKSK